MYQSAAYDLKFMFTRKPEMVSVRYDVQSFIPPSRQDFLLTDLAGMVSNNESPDTAAFLYCYLCYQTGRTQQLQRTLFDWGRRPSPDPWQAVLNRAWTTGVAK